MKPVVGQLEVEGKMKETQTGPAEYEVLEKLSAFDDSLNKRIEQIESGAFVNGQSPNGVLTSALKPVDPNNPKDTLKAQREFINEYCWALSLATYPYREQESREALMAAAVDGLFIAGETYDPEEEPNFLKHFGQEVGGYLEEVFGKAPPTPLPSADEFEAFVLANQQVTTAPDDEEVELPTIEESEIFSTVPVVEVAQVEIPGESEIKQTSRKPDKTALTIADQLEFLTPNQRMNAYHAGNLTLRELNIWAAVWPDEAPVINGEFEWIALTLADLD